VSIQEKAHLTFVEIEGTANDVRASIGNSKYIAKIVWDVIMPLDALAKLESPRL
jgi:hypothetical protein